MLFCSTSLYTFLYDNNPSIFSTTYDLFLSFSKAELNLNLEKDRPTEQAKIRYNLNEELISIVGRYREMAEKQFEKVNHYDLLMRDLLCSRLKILEDATVGNLGFSAMLSDE
jgi:hypothetical protein